MSKRQYEQDSGVGDPFKKRRHSDGGEDAPPLYFIFEGEVASVQKYGVFIKIPGYRKQGLVHRSQMSKAKVEDPSEMVSLREKVYCKVISIDEETNKIALSMKYVNQTSGKDLDPNNVEGSIDERRKKQGFVSERQKIELDAIYNTKCARCGTYGHLSKDCYAEIGGKKYDLIPELDQYMPDSPTSPSESKKKKKEKKKHKKDKKKKKKKHHHSSSDDSDAERKKTKHKSSHHSHKKRRRHHSSDSSDT